MEDQSNKDVIQCSPSTTRTNHRRIATSSSTSTASSKAVRFIPTVLIQEVPCRHDFSIEESSNCWYNKFEMTAMRFERDLTILALTRMKRFGQSITTSCSTVSSSSFDSTDDMSMPMDTHNDDETMTPSNDDHDQQEGQLSSWCSRGASDLDAIQQRQQRTLFVRDLVLSQYSTLASKTGGSKDALYRAVAEIYQQCSHPAVVDARERARKDEMDV